MMGCIGFRPYIAKIGVFAKKLVSIFVVQLGAPKGLIQRHNAYIRFLHQQLTYARDGKST